jgi:hypothetical protein
MNRRPWLAGLLLLALACSASSGTNTNPTGGGGGNGKGGATGSGSGGASQGSAGSSGNGGSGMQAAGGTTNVKTDGGTSAGGATGTGGAGTGTGGASGASGAGGATTSTGNSVLERNNHPSRDGHFLQPTLTQALAKTMAKDAGFAANFNGATWASPLYLENGPNGKGAFYIVTNDNNVFALDETTGAQDWMMNIGTAPGRSGQSCGDIQPIGIISTPIIDATARTIYVAGATGSATTITDHQIHALSVDDGKERAGWPISVTGMTASGATFTASPQNQRSALSLVNGILYVAYGGHNGDCGNYRGWIIAINTATPTQRAAWVTGGTRGEAIWAAAGMASDGNGIFAVTGNNLTGTSTHADSEEVIRITGMGVADHSNAGMFYPTSWRNLDTTDADLGANSPVYFDTPSPMVATITKDGTFFLLNAKSLGGMGGQLTSLTISMNAGAMAVKTMPASYTTAMGRYVVFTTNGGAVCPSNGGNGTVVMAVSVSAATPPVAKVAWCVPTTNAALGFPASPSATTTDGKANALVWFINGTKLMAVDGDTGTTIYDSGTATCTGVHKWTAPIAVKNRIVVSGDNHLCSWSPH